jgi:hypothetical protein
MNQLPVQRASELSIDSAPLTQWLVQGLWSDQAVGILGGEPKCCKSFLALDLAVSVASGTPCLRRFAVQRSGPVLLFPAEDSLAVVRQRLEGICSAAGADFQSLPVEVITAPALRLDAPKDRERLSNTVQARQPHLLILDPLIRLHRVDENDASQIAGLLSYLRQLQRTFHVAVLVVHHARKDANAVRPGQALRGSSELHGWGDSNLYMRRRGDQLTLSTEHRGRCLPKSHSTPTDSNRFSIGTQCCERFLHARARFRTFGFAAGPPNPGGPGSTRYRAAVTQTLRSAHYHGLHLPGSAGR